MKTKVIELIKELGFEVVATSPVYGVEDARVHAEKGNLTIITSVTSWGFSVTIKSDLYTNGAAPFYLNVATFCFNEGELPDLRFRKYTPELLELARRFGAVAGFEI